MGFDKAIEVLAGIHQKEVCLMFASIVITLKQNLISVKQALYYLSDVRLLHIVQQIMLCRHIVYQKLHIPSQHKKLHSLQSLIQYVSQSALQNYFHQHQHEFDQVELSCIIVHEAALAQQLYDQIQQGAPFEALTHIYTNSESSPESLPSLVAENYHYSSSQRLNWWALRDEVRDSIATALPGTVVGPMAINHRWYLIRVEAFLPATLSGELEQQLRKELVEQWLSEAIETLTAQIARDILS
jgi:hypothetical protein